MPQNTYREDGPVCRWCGKVAYRRKRSAARKLKRLERPDTRRHTGRDKRDPRPIEVYPCPVGSGWHVGHRRLPPPPGLWRGDGEGHGDTDEGGTDGPGDG